MKKLNVGDKVLVIKEGNEDVWVYSMNKTIGKIGTVTETTDAYREYGTLYELKFDSISGRWLYHPDSFIKLEEIK